MVRDDVETWAIRECVNGHREMLTESSENLRCNRCRHWLSILVASRDVVIRNEHGHDEHGRSVIINRLIGPAS